MPEIIINSFSIAICFLIGILAIFYLPFNKKGNLWFGIFLISLGFALLSKLIWKDNFYFRFPFIIPISELSRFAIAPSFYLSSWYYTHLVNMSLRKKILHFIPTVTFILFISLPYFLSIGNIIDFVGKFTSNIIGNIMRIALPFQIITYWILSYKLLKKHGYSILSFSSQRADRDLNWLLGILLGMLVLIFLGIVEKFKVSIFLNSFTGYLYLVVIGFMAYNLLRQKEVFVKNKDDNAVLENILDSKSKSHLNNNVLRLSSEELSDYKTTLDRLLQEEEVFMDPEIDLSSLAANIGISMNDLSFLINNKYDMNFYALINSFRIRKVQNMLTQKEHNHLTIIGIAYEAGFTSKSTFNNVFKKTTGLTPSAYMKKNS